MGAHGRHPARPHVNDSTRPSSGTIRASRAVPFAPLKRSTRAVLASLERVPTAGANVGTMLIEHRGRTPDRSWRVGRHTGERRSIQILQRFQHSLHHSVRHSSRVEQPAPIRRVLLAHVPSRSSPDTLSRAASLPAFVASVRSFASSSSPSARAASCPLRVAPHREHERPVACLEQLVRHQIRMRIPPPARFLAGHDHVLRHVHQRRRCAVRERREDPPSVTRSGIAPRARRGSRPRRPCPR